MMINKKILNINYKQLFGIIAALLLAAIASYIMVIGSGFKPKTKFILSGIFLIITLASSRWTYYILLLPICAMFTIYTPVGMNFGPPSYAYIASVFATDLMESREFIEQLPIKHILAGIAIIPTVIFYKKMTSIYNVHFLKNKTFVIIAIIFILTLHAPLIFIVESYKSSIAVKNEISLLNDLTHNSQWGKSSLNENAKYDDYILIVGESARKDYHHAYGYPVPNTPFMSSANGTLIDGLTSGGTNTIASLRLMFTKADTAKWEANYRLTLIDLIKSAGIKTYWISNQGYLGRFDTAVSSIANKSNIKIFIKKGDSFKTNESDFELLPHFTKVIEEPATGKRFIILHLYGSHPNACDRINDYSRILNDKTVPERYSYVNCYISSIKKTDEFLKRVYELLIKNKENNQRSFSMVYLSDHGLSSAISEGNIIINNSRVSKQHYNIPLFKISSDDTQRNEYKVFKSGLNFTNGIANWIGINNQLLDKKIDLFNDQSDKDDYGFKKIIESLAEDPSVVIPIK